MTWISPFVTLGDGWNYSSLGCKMLAEIKGWELLLTEDRIVNETKEGTIYSILLAQGTEAFESETDLCILYL